jgi:hypothetical protein
MPEKKGTDSFPRWIVAAVLVPLIGTGAAIYIAKTKDSKAEVRVETVDLRTDFGSHEVQYGTDSLGVRCPVTVPLIGKVSTSGDPGTVSYRFGRREGFNGPVQTGDVQTLRFDAPGTGTVRDDLIINIPEGAVYVEEWLSVIEPGSHESPHVRVEVHCDPSAPPNPPGPPPSVPG